MGLTRRDFMKAAGILAAGGAGWAAGIGSDGLARAGTGDPAVGTGKNAGGFAKADAHCHYVDFTQNSEGLESLLRHMEAAGVDHCLVTGLPVTKKWDRIDGTAPGYYLDNDSRVYYFGMTDVIVAKAVAELPAHKRRRLHPFLCGFNPTDRYAVDHVERMLSWYPGLWAGIGEIMLRHDDLTALTEGETPTADHPALDPVYELAASRGLPVLLHSNVGNKRLKKPVHIQEVANALARHPRTTMVLAHAGVSRGFDIPTIAADIRQLLESHDNLYLDLSWVVFDETVAPAGALDPRWVALVHDHPSRFMIGTDLVGHWDRYGSEIGKYDPFLAALAPGAASLVARDNFLRLVSGKQRVEVPSGLRRAS